MKNKAAKISMMTAATIISLTFGANAMAAGNGFGGMPGQGPAGGPGTEASFEQDSDDQEFDVPEESIDEEAVQDDSSRPAPPAKPKGQAGNRNTDSNRPEPPAKPQGETENGNSDSTRPAPPAKPANDDGTRQRPQGRPDGGGMRGLMEKINALEDGDPTDDLLEKAEDAEKAMKKLMKAAKEAGLVEDELPELPQNDSSASE